MSEPRDAYGLIIERDYETAYGGEIEPFWRVHAERCDFAGVGDVPIAAVKIVQPGTDIGVLISAGRTESFIKYKEVAYDLWKQGFSIYILDHRGQGLSGRMTSDRQMGHVEDFADYVSDMRTFVATVVRPRGHKHLAMLAHSMGGAIASLYLEGHHDDFDVAVLSSPMHEPRTGRISDDLACGALKALGWLGRTDRYAPGKGPYDETVGFRAADAHHAQRGPLDQGSGRVRQPTRREARGTQCRLGGAGLRGRRAGATGRGADHRPGARHPGRGGRRRHAGGPAGVLRKDELLPPGFLPAQSDPGSLPRTLHRERPVPLARANEGDRLH